MITFTVDLLCDGANCCAIVGSDTYSEVSKAIASAEREARAIGWKKHKGLWLCWHCQPELRKRK